MRISLDRIFIETAKLFAKRSSCVRKQVGAVLVKDDRIICCGYNGVPSGVEHCYEHNFDTNSDAEFYEAHGKWSRINELHAEQNIISYCARNGIATLDTTLYITLTPCNDCAKLIYSAGIRKVVYTEIYDREKDGIIFLSENGVRLEHWE